MSWYILIAWISVIYCLINCIYHFIRIIRLGKQEDYSESIGNIGSGVAWSFTGAMNPKKKESAYLHIPTYTAGMIYHIGTFISLALFFCYIFSFEFGDLVNLFITFFLLTSSACGIGILIKRMVKKELKTISNPDDFISNILVTLFQLITVIFINYITPVGYFLMASVLFFYLPLGKLKHTIYFFAARYQLGFFYGKRNVWPPKKQ